MIRTWSESGRTPGEAIQTPFEAIQALGEAIQAPGEAIQAPREVIWISNEAIRGWNAIQVHGNVPSHAFETASTFRLTGTADSPAMILR